MRDQGELKGNFANQDVLGVRDNDDINWLSHCAKSYHTKVQSRCGN